MSITVKHGSKKSLPAMKQLWQDAFGDSEEFIETFFTTFYRPSKAFLAFDNERLVSMLYYMDVKAKYFNKRLKCAYLYGVATALTERRQGHFRLLHDTLLEELKRKNYDAVLVMPAEDALFNFYKDFGYTISLKKFEYRLLTQELTEITDLDEIWKAKNECYKRKTSGLKILETKAQFFESRRGHRFYKSGDVYFAFAPTEKKYTLYEVINLGDGNAPVEQIHYERSAQLYDINSILDAELLEKQKPMLSYLMN